MNKWEFQKGIETNTIQLCKTKDNSLVFWPYKTKDGQLEIAFNEDVYMSRIEAVPEMIERLRSNKRMMNYIIDFLRPECFGLKHPGGQRDEIVNEIIETEELLTRIEAV